MQSIDRKVGRTALAWWGSLLFFRRVVVAAKREFPKREDSLVAKLVDFIPEAI